MQRIIRLYLLKPLQINQIFFAIGRFILVPNINIDFRFIISINIQHIEI